MTKSLPQIKAELLKEIENYLESKGVKGKDLKQRIKELKDKCPPDLRYNLLKLKDYYGERKDPIQYDNDGVAIIKQINQGEKQMGDRVELQKKIDALKKLNKAQLVSIAKEGRYMGVKFEPFTIAPGTDIKANVKSIAYELQDAMGLGSDKAKENQEATTKSIPANINKKTTEITKPAAKRPAPATKDTSGEITPLSRAKEVLKAEKEKSKGIIADLKAKGKTDIEVLKGKHKDALLQAAEKLTAEKEKGKTALEALAKKTENHLVAKMDKAGKDLSRLQVRLSLSLENERKLAGDNKRLLVIVKENNQKMSFDLRINGKLKTDLAKGIKFLEKLI